MEVVLTFHAHKRMIERSITLSEVELALSNPDILEVIGNNRCRAVKKVERRTVKVIYSIEGNKLIVVTVA